MRGFRLTGLGHVGELSMLPGKNGKTALLAIDSDACYRVRVPGGVYRSTLTLATRRSSLRQVPVAVRDPFGRQCARIFEGVPSRASILIATVA